VFYEDNSLKSSLLPPCLEHQNSEKPSTAPTAHTDLQKDIDEDFLELTSSTKIMTTVENESTKASTSS